MMKKILALVLTVVLLSGCGAAKRESSDQITEVTEATEVTKTSTEELNLEETTTAVETIAEKESDSKEIKLANYQVEISAETIESLPPTPDWRSENPIEEFIQGLKVPEQLCTEYNKKAITGELYEGRLEVIYNNIVIANVMYNKELGYYFEYENGLFKDGNILSVEKFLDQRTISQTGYFLGSNDYRHIEFNIDENLSKDPFTFLFAVEPYCEADNRNDYYINRYNSGFSVYYDPATSSTICLRFGKELGNPITISPYDISEIFKVLNITDSYTYSVGYLDSNKNLVYPVIIENEEGITFQIITEEKDPDFNDLFYNAQKGKNNFDFRIFNGNIYNVENVKNVFLLGSYCYGVWTSEQPIINKIPVDYTKLKNIEISQWDGGSTDVTATMDDITLFGGYNASYFIRDMIYNKEFEDYIAYQKSTIQSDVEEKMGITFGDEPIMYVCPTWDVAEQIIETSTSK